MNYLTAVGMALMLAIGYFTGYDHARGKAEARYQGLLAEYEKATREAIERTRRVEKNLIWVFSQVDDSYQRGIADAKAEHERVVSDLRTGAVRLRESWRGCESQLSRAAATAAEIDAEARDREASAARIVRAARDADRQIAALQSLLLEERRQLSQSPKPLAAARLQ